MAQAIPFIMMAVSAAGALAENQNQQVQMQVDAEAHQMDALALKQQAEHANLVAGLEEEAQRREGRQVAGEQRAAIGQAGIGLLSSTGVSLSFQSAKNAEQDALNIRYGGLLEAHGLMAKSAQSTFQAKAIKSQMGAHRASGYLKAAASGLSAYSNYGGTFGGGKKATAPTTGGTQRKGAY